MKTPTLNPIEKVSIIKTGTIATVIIENPRNSLLRCSSVCCCVSCTGLLDTGETLLFKTSFILPLLLIRGCPYKKGQPLLVVYTSQSVYSLLYTTVAHFRE